MNSELMAVFQTSLSLVGPVHNVRSDVVPMFGKPSASHSPLALTTPLNASHGSLDIRIAQMLVKRIMATVGTIIESDSIRKRFGEVDDILGDIAILGRITLTISPPTIRIAGVVSRGERG